MHKCVLITLLPILLHVGVSVDMQNSISDQFSYAFLLLKSQGLSPISICWYIRDGCAGRVTVIGAKSGFGEPISKSRLFCFVHFSLIISLEKGMNLSASRYGLNSPYDCLNLVGSQFRNRKRFKHSPEKGCFGTSLQTVRHFRVISISEKCGWFYQTFHTITRLSYQFISKPNIRTLEPIHIRGMMKISDRGS